MLLEGVVVLLGFLLLYMYESECVWIVMVLVGDIIILIFIIIDIEFEFICNYDFVEVIKRFLILYNCCDSI